MSSKIAHYFLVTLRLLRKQPFKQRNPDGCLSPPCRPQNLNSYFLQLPLELVFIIAKFLDPIDIVLLYQTCRSMYIIFQEDANATEFSRTEHLVYLAVYARGKPEEWVCENCMTLHPIAKLDTPAAIKPVSSCTYPGSWGYPSTFEGKRWDTRLWDHQIRIEHHHIQLALKYTRLQEEKYRTYLQALLASYHDKNFRRRYETRAEIHYSAYPKVVAGHDGNLRFLLFSSWRYYKDGEKISFDDIETRVICPHLIFAYRSELYPHQPNYALRKIVNKTFDNRRGRKERTGACSYCATDFSLQLHCQFLELRVWQDFGPEDSPLNLVWKTQCEGTGEDRRRNHALKGPRFYHKPGTIRKLYGD